MNKNDTHTFPIIFLDRDGTIIREVGYLSDPDGVQLLPGAADAIRMLKKAGFKVAVISNQSGVARGFFKEEDVHAVNRRMQELLKQHNAPVDKIYYCPHHPEGIGSYKQQCRCRKPESGLLRRAAADLKGNLSGGAVIGDKMSDVETALRLGLLGILVLTGFGAQQVKKYESKKKAEPSFIAGDLLQAVQWFLSHSKQDALQQKNE
ncbi:MAG: HAD family hydrolase [Calditrichia bacterium]